MERTFGSRFQRCFLSRYYHVLWVSKCHLLRDRGSKSTDHCLDILPIYYLIINHKSNEEISFWLLSDLADITGKDSKIDKNSPRFKHLCMQYSNVFKILSMRAIWCWCEIIEHSEQWEGIYRWKSESAWPCVLDVQSDSSQISKSASQLVRQPADGYSHSWVFGPLKFCWPAGTCHITHQEILSR